MVWLGWGRPCADHLPRRHPAPAPGPRFCRGRFQNTERRHLGSINRGDKTSADMMARGNGRCPLPRQPHPPSRKADTQTPSGSNHSLSRRTRGLKIPETARSPTPGLRQAHGRCSLLFDSASINLALPFATSHLHASGHPPAFPSGTCRKKG